MTYAAYRHCLLEGANEQVDQKKVGLRKVSV
jgi:hypothetical protein